MPSCVLAARTAGQVHATRPSGVSIEWIRELALWPPRSQPGQAQQPRVRVPALA